MNRLVLIDGNAILHRAYHALPPLTAPDGSVVNAVYGFASILLRLFNDLKPTHMAVAFDRPEPTFRKKMLKAYQAQRPEMEDTLVSQIPKVQDLVRAFGIPIYDAAGFEADDVIGTIAEQASKSEIKQHSVPVIPAKAGIQLSKHEIPDQVGNDNHKRIDEVIIVTGDRDILQLVNDRVKVFMPTKGLSEGKLFGESETKERMGVAPDQIPDLKALMGDPSDNYPGVIGIGPKTAVDLLARFGSLTRLYAEVKGKRKKEKGEEGLTTTVLEKLRKGEESAKLSKDLATIRTNAPVEADFDTMRITTLDTPEARGKLEEFNFQSLVKRLEGNERMDKVKKPEAKLKEKKAESEQLSFV